MRGLNITKETNILEDEALLYSRIERLLFTNQGERLGRPQIGSLLPKLFYEPADTDLLADILREIEYLITNYEPDLILDSISAEIVNEGELTGLLIKISCFRKKNEKLIEMEFFKVKTL